MTSTEFRHSGRFILKTPDNWSCKWQCTSQKSKRNNQAQPLDDFILTKGSSVRLLYKLVLNNNNNNNNNSNNNNNNNNNDDNDNNNNSNNNNKFL